MVALPPCGLTGLSMDRRGLVAMLENSLRCAQDLGPYEVRNHLRSLARVVLSLVDEVDLLASRVAGSDHGSAQPAVASRRSAVREPAREAASAYVNHTAHAPDMVEAIMDAEPERWWSTSELHEAVTAKGLAVTVNALSRSLCKSWVRRGWGRRRHESKGNQRQFRRRPVETGARS